MFPDTQQERFYIIRCLSVESSVQKLNNYFREYLVLNIQDKC